MTQTPLPSFASLLTRRQTVRRAAKVGLIVGTLLVAINQGPLILAGGFPPLWQVLLTYLVPYSVSSYSSAALWLEVYASDVKRS